MHVLQRVKEQLSVYFVSDVDKLLILLDRHGVKSITAVSRF